MSPLSQSYTDILPQQSRRVKGKYLTRQIKYDKLQAVRATKKGGNNMAPKIRISLIFAVLMAALMFSGCASQDVRMASEQTGLTKYTLAAVEAGADADYVAAKEILEKRLDEMGYEDYSISADSNGITLDIAEGNDEIISQLCKKGELYFREGAESDGEIIVSGLELTYVGVNYDTEQNNYLITLDFNEQGAEAFAEATERLVGDKIGVWLDGECIMAPSVSSKITGGKAVVTFGEQTFDEINAIAAQLKSGMLPFELKIA